MKNGHSKKKRYVHIIVMAVLIIGIGCLLEKLEDDRFVIDVMPPNDETNTPQPEVAADDAETDRQLQEAAQNKTETSVPSVEEEEQNGEKININTASIEKLCELDGIGESMAQRIVDYRDKYGDFENIEELVLVSGIGEKKLDVIRDKITVDE